MSSLAFLHPVERHKSDGLAAVMLHLMMELWTVPAELTQHGVLKDSDVFCVSGVKVVSSMKELVPL